MKLKRIGCGILAIILSLPLAAPINSYGASKFSDTSGHWAESYINTAVNQKIITGYPDGRFSPDKAVTRAEFATMVNKALGNAGTENLTFSDVVNGEWYYNDVSKAVAAAYTAGYDDNTFRPNNPITRQEAAVMISRIVPIYGAGGNLKTYSDYRTIADWAYDAVEKVNGKGYIGAYNDGKIHPVDQLTRGQTAKIICDIIDKETIVTSSPVIDDDGTKLSGKIYSNNVTIDEDLGEDSATIDNCVILGTLSVKGGGTETITVNNSRVANVAVNKDDDPVRILAKGQTAISKLSASQACILQTSSLGGGLFGPGFSNITVNGSAEVTLKGSFPKVNVSGTKAKVTLDSGTIDTLTVGGRYSNITAASSTTISTATVNTESYFHGSGTISQMNVNADDVTYETKPKKWTIASSADTPKESDETSDITFSPQNGATNVKRDTKITITFNEAMELYDGDSISNTDIDDFVELRKSSSSGSKVGYSASINSAKKIITITPDASLSADTRYYVIIDKNSIRDDDRNGNAAQSIYFTTGDDYGSVTTTFSPANGATAVPLNSNITITFSDDVVRYSNGATISTSDSYLKDCIVFKKTNSSGSNVSYSASISSSKKTITINPSSNLDLNQKYYVAIVANKLKTKDDGDVIPSASVTWTAGYTTPALNSFTLSPGNTSITATMTPNVAGKAYAVIVPTGSTAPSYLQIAAGQNSSGLPALASAKNESVAASVSVNLPSMGGLVSGVTYDVWATLYSNASGTYSTPVKQTATTTLPRVTLDDMEVRPILGGSIKADQITFNPTTYNYSVGLNSSFKSVELDVDVPGGATVTLTGTGLGPLTYTDDFTVPVNIVAAPLTITITATGATPSTYTVGLATVNDTSLKTLKINNVTQTVVSNQATYALTTSAISISLNVTANDEYATVSVRAGAGDVVSVSPGGSNPSPASYTLDFAEGSSSTTVDFNISSGDVDSPTYTILFTRPLE